MTEWEFMRVQSKIDAVVHKIRLMVSVYLTTKALVFKQKGSWVALPLSDVTDVKQTGMVGKYRVLVFGLGIKTAMVHIFTDSPNYVVDEILRVKAASTNSLRNRENYKDSNYGLSKHLD